MYEQPQIHGKKNLFDFVSKLKMLKVIKIVLGILSYLNYEIDHYQLNLNWQKWILLHRHQLNEGLHSIEATFSFLTLEHRYQIKVDCSSGQSKSVKLKDRINAPIWFTTLQIKKSWMHQIFNICWQRGSCWFMLLMLYLPLLDICAL